MIRPIEIMCFFLYVLDYVNYQKLKLNFPQVIFRWDESIGKVKGQFHDSHTFASKNVVALIFLQISLLDGSDFLF